MFVIHVVACSLTVSKHKVMFSLDNRSSSNSSCHPLFLFDLGSSLVSISPFKVIP